MRRALTYWIVWTIAWIIARTVFLMRVKGARNMPRTGPVIVVANHTSHLDPPLVAVALHTRRMGFLAKSELWKSRFLGWLIGTLGSIPIERGASDRRAYEACLQTLRDGKVLLVFPEGTRSATGQLKEFEAGAARLAAAVPGCQVLPVKIRGSFEAWGTGKKYPKPWPVRIDVAPPFSTDDLRKQFGDKKSLFQAIQGEMLRRLS
jgi:1-acyl-sn-glycerol-3-phosphate acyltransferase